METKPEARRKYPRLRAPKGLFVGWKSSQRQDVSRAETIGLGGLFLHTPKPPAEGAMLELLFDVAGGEVRARAVVRHSLPDKGMGIQFVQMRPEIRARLNRFLSKNEESAQRSEPADKPKTKSAPSEKVPFEKELQRLLNTAQKGTYYQLLGITSETPNDQIKQSFYGLARKFHPDHHMEKRELSGSLKVLMAALTEAYKTLKDEQARAIYDKRIATTGAFSFHRSKTESQESLDECSLRAAECLRANNFVGSIVWLRKCVEIAPHEPKHHALLARSLGTVSQYRDEAVKHFQMSIELDPWNTTVYLQLAELYEEMQLRSRAHSIYSKILGINPVHTKARERLAELDRNA
jgi:curved DNA-binding protein CbpA